MIQHFSRWSCKKISRTSSLDHHRAPRRCHTSRPKQCQRCPPVSRSLSRIRITFPKSSKCPTMPIITSVSIMIYLERKVIDRLSANSCDLELVAAGNAFAGASLRPKYSCNYLNESPSPDVFG